MTDTIESLRQQLAECQATNGKLRAVISENHEWHKLYDIYDGYIESDLASSNSRALALPSDDTCLNELIAERTKELTAEVERLSEDVSHWRHQSDEAGMLRVRYGAKIDELTAQRDELMKVIAPMLEWFKGADHSTGYCCCGMRMDTHGNPMNEGHSPLDEGDYHAMKLIDLADAAIANCKEQK